MANAANSIVLHGVTYDVEPRAPGKFRAVDAAGATLWSVELERSSKDPFAAVLTQESDDSLLVEDARQRVHRVNLTQRTARLVVWPVRLRIAGRAPLRVEVEVSNSLDRTLSFDKPSIAFEGKLENDLFEIKADGKPVPYSGMMKKRAPPASFLKLAPGKSTSGTVDLTSGYAIPRGAALVEVRFAHHNHFSKDAFDLASPPITFAPTGP